MIVNTGKKFLLDNGLLHSGDTTTKYLFFLQKLDDGDFITTPELTSVNNIISFELINDELPDNIWPIAEPQENNSNEDENNTEEQTGNIIYIPFNDDGIDYYMKGYINKDSNNRQIKINAFIFGKEGTTVGTYGAAGLIISVGSTQTLFSRVTFAQSSITAGNRYELEYIIYF